MVDKDWYASSSKESKSAAAAASKKEDVATTEATATVVVAGPSVKTKGPGIPTADGVLSEHSSEF
jgi:hypothetical protein